MNGLVVGVFHTDIDVFAWVGWGCMGVAMDVGKDFLAQAEWVERDVAVDQSSMLVGALDLLKACTGVDVHGEVIVVAQD